MSYNSVGDYVKNAESNRNPAVLNSLLEGEPGMKELPEITAEDEGKILQVNNGKPSWSSSSSGGGALVVNINWHDDPASLDKTWQEIHDALAQGIPCVTVYTDRNAVEQGQIVYASGIPGNYYVSVLSAQGTTPVVVKWTATSADGYPSKSTGGGDVA